MNERSDRLTVVGIYAWWTFWALGEGKGSPSFYLSPKGFVRAGHRIVIVMPRRDAPSGPDTYRGIELERYRGGPGSILENPARGRLVRTIVRSFTYWRYVAASLVAGARVCRRVRPDAIVAYGDYSVVPAFLLARVFGVPNVTRLFGTNLARFLGRPFWLLYHYIHVLPFKIPADAVIICNDGSEGERVAHALGLRPEKLRFWRNGSDHDVYRPASDTARLRASLNLPSGDPFLFTVARLHPEKHLDLVLAALPIVRARHPSVRFLLVGDGPDRGRLESVARSLGVEDLVVWTGAIERERLPAYVSAGDLFVAACDRTNAANPLFEAMLAGKASVVLDTGDTSSVIEHGVNGWLVPSDRPSELGPTIARVLSDPAARAAAGSSARAWAVENIPTLEARQKMEVGVVEEVVRRRRRKGT